MEEIKGIISAISYKFNGGIMINNKWFNFTENTKHLMEGLNKNDMVDIQLDEKGKINSVNKSGNGTTKEKAGQTKENTNGDDKSKSISVSYAKDCFVAEIQALAQKCKDLNELEKAIEERKKKIGDTANGFYKLMYVIPYEEVEDIY